MDVIISSVVYIAVFFMTSVIFAFSLSSYKEEQKVRKLLIEYLSKQLNK